MMLLNMFFFWLYVKYSISWNYILIIFFIEMNYNLDMCYIFFVWFDLIGSGFFEEGMKFVKCVCEGICYYYE